MYKKLYEFLLYGCKKYTNCGTSCPFGEWIKNEEMYYYGYYHCKLHDIINEENLIKLFNEVEPKIDDILNRIK